MRFVIFICALFAFGTAHATTLNIRQNGGTTKITLNTIKPTTPALAMRVGGRTMYAAMARATTTQSGGLYVKYNNQTYHVLESAPESKFQITTTSTTNSFDFTMSAAGTFYIDWGDGTVDEIVRANTVYAPYSHTYMKAGTYNIGFSGTATGYSTGAENTDAAISFSNNKNVAGISGSLGEIFSTIKHFDCLNGICNMTKIISIEQPMFRGVFRYCTNLGGTIPENLFSGIEGQPIKYIFAAVFYGCENIGGTIPENLFKNIKGYPAYGMFDSVFAFCKNLTGQVPEKLFAGISGAPARDMFAWTFNGCTGLSGSIPANLFSGISGVPAEGMYAGTFYKCSGLSGTIPDGLFGNLYGAPDVNMFAWTFDGATQMTGHTARTATGVCLYDIEYNGVKWQNNSVNAFGNMYTGTNIRD